jgi:hypothetical protein
MKDNLSVINKEFQSRTYKDLSLEFQKLLPSAVRASELIALMYNRLTLVENYSHKEAVTKIHDDHKHLAGFSSRNIRRSLPLDNQNVPRRVRPLWPKNSQTEDIVPSELRSNTIQGQNKNPKKSLTDDNTNHATKPSCQSAECSGCISLSLENRELKEAVLKSTKLITADNVAHTAAPYNVLEFEFPVPKKEILDSWGEVYLDIADADMQVWFNVKVDTKNHRVISAKTGRLSQQQGDSDNTGNARND